ncbi:FAD-dependent oxidoreductase [Mycobacterium shinjukuense]|uniref:Amine oxidase domain-containing protein n=1 Tax=Mycobacterium shinjukuense TaxID=398694 RepID=A0A7I7MQG8_9MYCO|nr:hypothetical protein MSHI_24070 [Mycobacterium shinjukuense]
MHVRARRGRRQGRVGRRPRLADAGWPLRLIEARDRIGGQVHTNRDRRTAGDGRLLGHDTTGDPLTELARNAPLGITPPG